MLASLSIRDIVLIEALDLEFNAGLTVLTGETGAGKSILLDSLSLAIGARADRALVREGAEQGRVTATFEVAPTHPACVLLEAEGFDADGGQLMLRRQVTKDGRSKAWINDEPLSRGLLSQVGVLLVEIHGQHDDRGLLDPAGHRTLLDLYASNEKQCAEYKTAWLEARARRQALRDAEAELAASRTDEEFLRHAVEELQKLAPEPGEEQQLADKRAAMMQGEKLAGDLADFQRLLQADGGVDASVRGVLRRMERIDTEAQTLLAPVMGALDRAAIELGEALEALDRVAAALEFDPHVLEETEERLFELRRLARKHEISADALNALQADFSRRIDALDLGDARVAEAQQAVSEAEAALVRAGEALSKSRIRAAKGLDAAVIAELPPLKLEKANFRTRIETQALADWSEAGSDTVEFEVKTNPGTPFGPMTKIASGGETARFILALKVVLGAKSSIPVMIFDEVDRGIGGATADAVGERLARLAQDAQVLVVTHSPQVAACGVDHMNIAKSDSGRVTRTHVATLDAEGRVQEIARMLAGAEITPEARAAAERLMGGR